MEKTTLNCLFNKQSTSASKIDSLQYLRAFAAIWVLITHVLQRLQLKLGSVALAGQWGVDVFFLLSGFIIYFTTREGSNWKSFAIKRIFRIYPAYLVCFTIYYCISLIYNDLYGGGYSSLQIIQNVLMIPFSEPIGYRSLIVGQAWSTCYELYFYTVFTLILLFGWKKKWLLPSILVLFVIGFAYNYLFHPSGLIGYVLSLAGRHHVLFFCEGIFIAEFLKILESIKLKKELFIILFIAIFAIYLYFMCNAYNSYISFVISPIVFCAVYMLNKNLTRKSLAHRIMVYLGNISFSIYLIHSVIIRILLSQCHITNFALLLACTLTVTLLFSALCYAFIEQPFIRLGKNISAKINSKHAANK